MLLYAFIALILPNALAEEPCKDLSPKCAEFQRKGWCKTVDRDVLYFLKTDCRYTCDFCDELTKPHRDWGWILDEGECIDRSHLCKVYKRSGWCTSEDIKKKFIVRNDCKKTCGFCPTESEENL